MAKYLDLLLGWWHFHKVEQRSSNTFVWAGYPPIAHRNRLSPYPRRPCLRSPFQAGAAYVRQGRGLLDRGALPLGLDPRAVLADN